MKKGKAKKTLLMVWGVFLLASFILGSIWIATDLFGIYTKSVLNWLIQMVVPYTTLVFSAVLVSKDNTENNQKVDLTYFRFAVAFSIIYILCIIIVAVGVCYSNFKNQDPSLIFNNFTIWISLIQSILTGLLGAFFLKKPDNSLQP